MLIKHKDFNESIELTDELISSVQLMLPICQYCIEFKKNRCEAFDILCCRKYKLYKKAKKIESKKLRKKLN